MDKKIFFHSLLTGVLAGIAAIIYDRIYFFATEVDFSKVLTPAILIGMNLIVALLAGFIFSVSKKMFNEKGEIVFNFFFSIVSFACVVIPISITLPLTVAFPELFPGLAVPMVFFPAMAWFTTRPLFQ